MNSQPSHNKRMQGKRPEISIMMWLMKNQIALLATFGVMIVILVPAMYLFLLLNTPLSFRELDFDNNGIVTFSELVHANLYCDRVILNGQVICKE